ncbi:MAG: hypothetical protein Q9P01_19005 [Anaerolineae bacterium]|nr:hypothetical protein [Anaerolineae bacterium]MDQ7036840.1 hypothetical protein [Anaerolineae bacterium]
MKARMERILKKLAQRHRPYLLQNLPTDIDDRLRLLADGLAKEGVLVIVGDVPPENYEVQVSRWVGAYGDLCLLMAKGIFPSLAKLSAVYADNNRPPIVVVEGQPAAVMEQLGRYVAPFLAMRQNDNRVTDAELRGLMQFMLDELEAQDLARAIFNHMWQEGIKILRYLLQMDVTHYAVTSAARPLMLQFQREQAQMIHIPQTLNQKVDGHKKPPLPPELLPEETPPIKETDSEELFLANIPLFPRSRRSGTDIKRRTLPVRLPPELRDDGDS